MSAPLLVVPIRYEEDVVAARQRARSIAHLLGFDRIDQTRLATAVSEIARNAFMYAKGGTVEYRIEGDAAPQLFQIQISDRGPGIAELDEALSGRYRSATGLGIGLSGARRLVDRCEIESTSSGTTVTLAKLLPARTPWLDPRAVGQLAGRLAAERPEGPLQELQEQNHELLRALDALRARQEELQQVNRELEDTNRGVVALYAELDERADHLRRADEVKTKFLSNMTHEFRTPLNSILALARLLRERLPAAEHEKDELFYIGKSAQQLSDLVDDLLDIAKVEAGKIEVRPAYFEVAGLFGALRGMLRPLLTGQSVALVFEEPVGLPPLYSDESKIAQVLRNFISNALKYTEHGEIRVSASFRRDEGLVEFAVTDTGIGIPADDLPRIFDEFVQIENPLQRRAKGTGLGLPLSKRLAALLGGDLRVGSTLGAGSTFVLTVPAMYRAPLASPDVPSAVPGLVRVLVVEDADEDALAYQRLLASTRYQVVRARTAEEAEALVRLAVPAAVVLDVQLHGVESWDLLVRLKQDPVTAALPVIVAATVDDRRKAFALGATAFGQKPIDRHWLLRTLDAALRPDPALRVLTIDDDEAGRFIVREVLPEPEYRVSEAASGREGVTTARQNGPDVVLVDLNLPDMSGYDVIAELTADPATAHVPIIMVTALPLAQVDESRLPPRSRVLAKATLNRDTLRSAVREVLLVAASPVRLIS